MLPLIDIDMVRPAALLQHSLHSRYVETTINYSEPVGVVNGDDHMKRAACMVGPGDDGAPPRSVDWRVHWYIIKRCDMHRASTSMSMADGTIEVDMAKVLP